MERIMNKENDWNHNVEGDAVEGPIDSVCKDDIVQVLSEAKNR